MNGRFQLGPWLVQPDLNVITRDRQVVRLTPKAMDVLVCLAECAGEAVSKEKLIQAVWPDTFVSDDVLKGAILELRRALEDDAREPRFIETIPKRGYRLIAAINRNDVGSTAAPPATITAVISTRKRKFAWAIATCVVLVAAAGGLLSRLRQPPHLTERDTVVLGDFANSTGDPVFDGTLREGLSVQLQQSPFLNILSEDSVHQTLRMMGQPSARLTPEITREICRRTNSTATLDGSLALIGTRYDLVLKAVNCASGEVLASAETQATDKSHVLDALGNAASEIRRRLGESLSSVQKYNTPLVQVTTPSLEALQAFSIASKLDPDLTFRAGDVTEQLPLLQRATQLDPGFAFAYKALSDSYSVLGESALAAENARRAYELRAGVSEYERLIIEEEYCWYVTGNLFMAQQADELGMRMYPRSSRFNQMFGVLEYTLGQPGAGLEHILEAVRLAPENSFLRRRVVMTYLLLDRVEKAEAAAKEAQAKGLDSDLPAVLYGIAFYRGNSEEMARQAANPANSPYYKHFLVALEADTAAYFGHLGKARELSRQAADFPEGARDQGTATEYSAVAALREALFGNAVEARRQAAVIEKHASGRRDVNYAVALALAYAGQAKQAQALADDLAKKYPEDTEVQNFHLPTLRAKLALTHANPREALDILKAAAPYELGLPSMTFYNWPNLYPVYVRGEAYLAAHHGGEAATEFQKILDHRGIVLNEPIGALAHLQLGRAYALQGDAAKARAAYQDFLTLWKDADPDIPVLRQAKAEYAKVK